MTVQPHLVHLIDISNHLNPVTIIQKEVISTQKNSLAAKKGAALFKMASVKKLGNQRGGQEIAVTV